MKTLQLYFNNDSVSVRECYSLTRTDMITVAEESSQYYLQQGFTEGYHTGFTTGTIYGVCLMCLIGFGIYLFKRRKQKAHDN